MTTIAIRRMIATAALLAVSLLGATGAVWADDDDPAAGVREIVAKLEPGATIDAVNTEYGTRTEDVVLASRSIYLLRAPENVDVAALSDALEADARVVYAEPNYVGEAPEGGGRIHSTGGGGPTWVGTDPATMTQQYAVGLLRLAEAHRRTTGAGTLVAVLDTGVQLDHPRFAGRLAAGYDFVDDDATPSDVGNGTDDDGDGRVDEGVGHGTHVAGIVTLTAPSTRILPLRVLDSDGRGNIFTTAEAITAAVEAGADVINASFGTTADSELLGDIVEDAEEDDVVVVAAAGNLGADRPQYPAADDDALGVTASGPRDARPAWASYGSWVDVAAPGADIVSAFPTGGYAVWGGTSMAAPFVAGQAALIRSLDAEAEAETIEERIVSSARPAGSGSGRGRIDVLASLNAGGGGEGD